MRCLNLPTPPLVMATRPCLPAHRAPSVSLSSFQGHRFAAIAAAALLVPSLPASAVFVSIVEDTATRFAFDVFWGSRPFSPNDSTAVGGFSGSSLFVIDNDSVIQLGVSTPFATDGFEVSFTRAGSSSRVFEPGDLVAFSGSQSLGLVSELYGARFVYGSPFPVAPPTGVPDGGASALLLSTGLAGLTLLRRTLV